MPRLIILVLLLAIAWPAKARAQATCAGEPETCKIEGGEYTIRLPKNPAGPIPALIYFHGAGGSGPGAMRNTGMVNAFLKRGYAVIAPSGLKRPNTRFGPGWSFLPFRKKQRDELAFAKAVLADASSRFGIDRNNILMSGFSIGSSLVWYLACEDPAIARAYAPVAGAFWRPHPKATDCAGPVKMLHTHGWRDGTVPLEGRPLRGGAIKQGDVFFGLQLMREINDCSGMKATSFDTSEKFWRRKWEKCTPGSALEFALHTGGHGVPPGWATMAIDWFESLPSVE